MKNRILLLLLFFSSIGYGQYIKKINAELGASSPFDQTGFTSPIVENGLGYVIGTNKQFGSSDEDPIIFGLDESGNFTSLFKRYKIEDTKEENIHILKLNFKQFPSDNGFFMVGKSTDPTLSIGEFSNFLIRTDIDGNWLWSKKLQVTDPAVESKAIEVVGVEQTQNGNIIIAGNCAIEGRNSLILFKINHATGAIIQSQNVLSSDLESSQDFDCYGLKKLDVDLFAVYGQSGNERSGIIFTFGQNLSGPKNMVSYGFNFISGSSNDLITDIIKNDEGFLFTAICHQGYSGSNTEGLVVCQVENNLLNPTDITTGAANSSITYFSYTSSINNTFYSPRIVKSGLDYVIQFENTTSPSLVDNPISLKIDGNGVPIASKRLSFDCNSDHINKRNFSKSGINVSLNRLKASGEYYISFANNDLNVCSPPELNPNLRSVDAIAQLINNNSNSLNYVYIDLNVEESSVSLTQSTICEDCVPLPTVDIDFNQTCQGDTMSLTATSGYVSYTWTDASGTVLQTGPSSTCDVTSEGIYCVEVTNIEGCVNSNCIEAEFLLLPEVSSLGIHNLCPYDAPIILADRVSAFGYNVAAYPFFDPNTIQGWFNTVSGLSVPPSGFVTFDPSVSGPGSFDVVYTIQNPLTGCENSATLTINVQDIPHVGSTLELYTCGDCDPILLGKKDNISNEMVYTNGFSPLGEYAFFTPSAYISEVISGDFTEYYFYPCDFPFGVYEFEYNYAPAPPPLGCFGTAIGTIDNNPPAFQVYITGEDNLCPSGSTILTANIGGGSSTYSYLWQPNGETTSSISVSSPGVYSVTVTDDVTGCEVEASYEVFDGGWHQFTKNATSFDEYNDVVTDGQGNVYVTGSFVGQTTLYGGENSDETIVSLWPAEQNAFVAKYDPCGNLLWVTQANESHSSGNALVLDEVNNKLYVTGDFQQVLSFLPSQGADAIGCPAIGTLSSTSELGFLSQIDMSNGCVNLLSEVNFGTNLCRSNAITIDEASTSSPSTIIYIGGHKGVNSSDPDPNVFIRKYSISAASTSFGAPVWSEVSTGYGLQTVRDMDFDEAASKLWITGSFNKNIVLLTSSLGTHPGTADAFITCINDAGGFPTLNWLSSAGNSAAHNNSIGNGIVVDETNHRAYITGSYEGNFSAAFGFSGNTWNDPDFTTIVYPPITSSNAYLISLQYGLSPTAPPTLIWSREQTANNGHVRGTAVDFNGSNVLQTGTFDRNMLFEENSGPASSLSFVSAGSGNNDHVFSTKYSELIGATSTINGTTDPSTNNATHKSNAIAFDNANGHAFIVGTFNHEMSYLLGSPYSGDLSATSPSSYNAFVMRVDQSDGSYKSQQATNENEEEIADEISIQENNLDLSIYPNPTNGELKVELNEFDAMTSYRVELRSITGQLIFIETLNQQTSNFDLSDLDNGIYLISISNGESNITKRIVKQ